MKFLKNKKKPVLLLLAVLTICLCFTGCGGGEIVELTEEEEIIQNSTLVKPSQNNDFKYNIYTEYVALTEYIGSSSSVNIPEKIEDKPVLVISEECFAENETITSVNIPDTLFRVDTSAFEDCTNLQRIKFSKIMTSFPQDMCSGCDNLREIEIPDSIVTIGMSAFRDCISLTKVTIPRNVTTISDGAFSGCDELTEIVILEGKIVEDDVLTRINYLTIDSSAFANLEKLEKVVMPDTVTTIEDSAFSNVNKDCMFYGYAPSTICTYCADLERKYKFTEIKEDDEFDKLIKATYSKMTDEIKTELENKEI